MHIPHLHRLQSDAPSASRGSALVLGITLAVGVFVVTLGILQFTKGYYESQAVFDEERGFELAEEGIQGCVEDLVAGREPQSIPFEEAVSDEDRLLWVETDSLEEDGWRVHASVISPARRTVVTARLEQTPRASGVPFALFADERLELGPDTQIDSYDSTQGPYESQVRPNPIEAFGRSALDSARIGSNGTTYFDTDVFLLGDVIGSPEALFEWFDPDRSAVRGEEGWLSAAFPLGVFDTQDPPAQAAAIQVDDTAAGIDRRLEPGRSRFESLLVASGAELQLVGPLTLWIDRGLVVEGSVSIDDRNGPVVIYAQHRVLVSQDGALHTTSGSARGLFILVPTTVDSEMAEEATVAVAGQVTGVLYAPNAEISLEPGAVLYGSAMARFVRTDETRIHFDEALTTCRDFPVRFEDLVTVFYEESLQLGLDDLRFRRNDPFRLVEN